MSPEMNRNELRSREIWDSIYKKEKGRVESTLQVDNEIPCITELFKERNVRRVLDLGCGAGRHLIYLAQKGFDAYGIDISGEAIKKAKLRLNKLGFSANLKVGSMTSLPYRDNFFDALISTTTIHHGMIQQIKKTIREIERVMKPAGLIFITVPKKRSKKKIPKERLFGIKFIAPRAFIILDGEEKGLPHYQFNKDLLRKNFKNFKIIKLWVNDKGSYCLLGELKKVRKLYLFL
jgi:ubiquinone/menaquinone biosynthesis C-methylase UbiE